MKANYKVPSSIIVNILPITQLLLDSKNLGGGGIDKPIGLVPSRKIYI